MNNITRNILIAFCLMLSGCGNRYAATAVDGSQGPLVIYPDYKEVTIPANIAPLNFHYAMSGAEKAVTTFTMAGKSVTIKGLEVEWPLRKWKSFMADAAGKTITVKAQATVEGKTVTDAWSVYVSPDDIDG